MLTVLKVVPSAPLSLINCSLFLIFHDRMQVHKAFSCICIVLGSVLYDRIGMTNVLYIFKLDLLLIFLERQYVLESIC